MRSFAVALIASLLVSGCGSDEEPVPVVEADSGAADSSVPADTQTDTNPEDSGAPDTATDDTTAADSATTETATADSAAIDSKVADVAADVAAETTADTAAADTTVVDTAMTDTAMTDTAMTDTAMTDTAMTDTSAADTAMIDAGASCNTLTQLGTSVTINRVASAPPTLAGTGVVPSGTYVLTALTSYTGSGGATGTLGSTRLTTTIVATSSTTFTGQGLSDDFGVAMSQRSTTTTAITGANFTQTWICKSPLPLIGPLSGTYEFSGTTLKLLYTASNALYVLEKLP